MKDIFPHPVLKHETWRGERGCDPDHCVGERNESFLMSRLVAFEASTPTRPIHSREVNKMNEFSLFSSFALASKKFPSKENVLTYRFEYILLSLHFLLCVKAS